MQIDAFMITKSEEEVITGIMDCWWSIRDVLGVLSIVDNGSSDCTRMIIDRYAKMGLPINVMVNRDTPHHGQLRTQAISVCKSPWIIYADSDETFSDDLVDWLKSDEPETADIWDFWKYSTIQDCWHYTDGGNGPSTRMFRNVPGVHFPQNIHTHPEAPAGLDVKRMCEVLMCDHTGVKSVEALWAKGQKYRWADGTIGIGSAREYVWRIETAYEQGNVVEFPEEIKSRFSTGPHGQWA
jgi:glycosyltransferase involved in cell wall biosynthesis